MRVTERGLQVRMSEDRLRHAERLMLVKQSCARMTQIMAAHLRKPEPLASRMNLPLENISRVKRRTFPARKYQSITGSDWRNILHEFLPACLQLFAFALAGVIGGRLVAYFAQEGRQPQRMWWVIVGIGFLTALLLWIYDRIFKPGRQKTS